jgi:peptide/nickel transport system permease protein
MRVRRRLTEWRRGAASAAFVFKHNKAGMVGLGIVSFFILMAVFAPYIAPYNPYKRVASSLLPPSSRHLLGTNDMGQDILSELIWGARVSLSIGFSVALVVMTIGTTVGLVAGYAGGLVDEVLMRLADIILVLPSIPLMILIAAILGRHSFHVMVIALSVVGWGGLARMVRAVTLSLKERGFVEAARALGAGGSHVMLKHILPNTAPLILSSIIYQAVGAMMAEAGLSFLGLGDPTAKSWGMMLHYAQSAGGWWGAGGYPMWNWIIPPGLCIALVVLGLMLMGQAVEEIVNPRLRRR